MKLLLAFNLAAFAFVLVTNGGYVPEIVEGQDPYCELGIIAGNLLFGWMTFCGWWIRLERLKKNFADLYRQREELFAWKQQHIKITGVSTPKEYLEAGHRLQQQQAAQQLWAEAKSDDYHDPELMRKVAQVCLKPGSEHILDDQE